MYYFLPAFLRFGVYASSGTVAECSGYVVKDVPEKGLRQDQPMPKVSVLVQLGHPISGTHTYVHDTNLRGP